ncbi:hypothetical protein RhiXN_08229 [Rhizoctonia solani]|uniref:Uncharacterized protein n=1 Tax=Rhizoctonia solani TaxID=456999 RepID=A0A8H8P251_9AGAM|nr:uncharacterized protein RhiXN_08229 [Rhizoctonia solani]QRW23193.1 hypothetical protein RhiXN_08229 [Rhizoctonia solani]
MSDSNYIPLIFRKRSPRAWTSDSGKMVFSGSEHRPIAYVNPGLPHHHRVKYMNLKLTPTDQREFAVKLSDAKRRLDDDRT